MLHPDRNDESLMGTREENQDQFATTRIIELKKEYERINAEWLGFHYQIAFYFSLAACFIEIAVSVIVLQQQLITTSVPIYFLKYLFIPTISNIALLITGYILMKNQQLSHMQRLYSVSMMFVLICFVITTIHNISSPVYALYILPIVITGIYAVPHLTMQTGILSISLFLCAEFLIAWNPYQNTVFESPLRLLGIVLIFALLVMFTLICTTGMYYLQKKNIASINLELEREELEQKLHIDELTGIANRLAFNTALSQISEQTSSTRYVLVMTDIDRFKKINDDYGHYIGDQCLTAFATILNQFTTNQIAYRFGGDEFCLLFQDVTLTEVYEICLNLQKDMQTIIIPGHEELRITASFGLAEYSNERGTAELFLQADNALYHAKKERNKVVIVDEIA